MKQDIHPQYNEKAKITCACGNELTVGSTEEEIEVEICSNCHPFYTGKKQLVDTAGRAEKFKERQKRAEKAKKKRKKEKEKEKTKKKEQESEVIKRAREQLEG